MENQLMPNALASPIRRSVALVLILAAGAAGSMAQADPVTVEKQLLEALTRGDVATAVSFFADDAVIDSESGLCAKSPCVGKAAIQKDFERYVGDKSRHSKPLKSYLSGDVLVTRFEARSDTVQKAGVERIILWGIREFRGDKIISSRCCMPERTDPQTAKFIQWEYSQK
jgi:hypothetical protein